MSDAVAALDPATPVAAVDRALGRVRPLVGAGLVVYVVVRADEIRLRPVEVAALLVGAVALTLSHRIAGRISATDERALVVRDVLAIAVDSFVTVFAITRLSIVDEQLGWALLVVPVLEGALRFRMRGVVAVWCCVTAAYTMLELQVPADMGDPLSQGAFLLDIQTLVYRAGVVLLVAVPGGFLSDQLLRAITAQRRAQVAATDRNDMLSEVVDAGRSIVRSGIDLPAETVGAAVALGFDDADWVAHTPGEGWAVSARAGAAVLGTDAFGRLAVAAATGGTMRAGADDADAVVRTELELAGVEEVVAVPVRIDDVVVAVVRAATRIGRRPTVPQIEGLELLAAQAGVAGENARLLADLDRARSDLEHQATHDALTGLPNRAYFQRALADGLAALHDAPEPLSVLFLDLDRFKQVNDTLGHDVGDELLIAVAERLLALLDPRDVVARLGGDEFIVLCPGRDLASAGHLSDGIVDRIGTPFPLSQHTVSVGASVGVVVTDEPMEAGELVRRGDLAMYQAKNNGRNTWRAYSSELDATGQAEATVDADLRAALADGLLEVDCAIVLAVPGLEPMAAAASIRWTRPGIGVVPVAEFTRIAERAGLAEPLGELRLGFALAVARRWARSPGPERALVVSANVSARQLRRDGFADRLLARLVADGVPPGQFVVGISESECTDRELHPVLERLRTAGVRVSVDAFGGGSASILDLAAVPADVLRISPDVVSGIDREPRRAAAVRAVTALAAELGMAVVATGVERLEEAKCLAAAGAVVQEGPLFHLPMPVAAVESMLRADATRTAARLAAGAGVGTGARGA